MPPSAPIRSEGVPVATGEIPSLAEPVVSSGLPVAAHHDHQKAGAPTKRQATKAKRGFPTIAMFVAVVVGAGTAAWFYFRPVNAPPAIAAQVVPVEVGVQTVDRQKLRLWNDYSGRLRAVDAADIRPEVSGRITEVRFQDGQSVQVGDILLVIDPTPFEAAVARAQARIATAKANLEFTTADQSRNSTLFPAHAVAQREVDQSNDAQDAANAELLAAQAELKTAEVDLNHAYVKAPISGRLSRAELTVGNFVQTGANAPLLVSIVSENGIYADFEVDEQTYLETIRDSANGNAQEKTIPVELTVQGDTGHPYKGFIRCFDNKIDSASGTIRGRAKFDNADRTLVPGMFVSVRLASSRERDALLVADRAIGFDQSKRFVYVVSPENKVAYREVELGKEVDGRTIVLKGLENGDRVIVDGTQRVRPDAVVSPQEVARDAGREAGVTATVSADTAKANGGSP